jgi:catechol 2,3-dioxygenase-like lactoylglutathione lyase family enzyme
MLGSMAKRAIAFVATAKPEEAITFYRDVLSFALLEDTPFALVFDAFGTALRVQKAAEVVLAPYTSFGIEVEDIEAEARVLFARGVAFVRYPQFDQDDLGIWRAPGGAKVAWFRDPDGNLLSLSQL